MKLPFSSEVISGEKIERYFDFDDRIPEEAENVAFSSKRIFLKSFWVMISNDTICV